MALGRIQIERNAAALAVLAGLAACGPPSSPGDDGADRDAATVDASQSPTPDGASTDLAPVRDCVTHFQLQPDGAVSSVELAGEWDWNAREPMSGPNADGVYTVDKELAAGIWAYKFVLTRPNGAIEWILDPVNQYRAYDGGRENSGARVEDCAPPLLAVVGSELSERNATVRLRLWRGRDGAAIDQVRATRRFEGEETEVAVAGSGGQLTIDLTDLPLGKHTVVVTASAADGFTAEPVLVPFWIEPEPFDWRDSPIYMAMVDRFRNGRPDNDPEPNPAADPLADYYGGDVRGVTDAIEDGTFAALGVRVLWLSPLVENTRRVHAENRHGVSGYHGYWPIRARAIDPRFGTEAELDALVTAAHRQGIRVLMDFVINHVHEDHEYFASHPEWFRNGCECGTAGCDWTTHRLDCSFHSYMPDVDWQRRDVSEQMIADAMWWLERFDLDGMRVDAVKHVEDLAIFNLSTRIHERFELGGLEYFLLGETAMGWRGDDVNDSLGEYNTISRYIGDRALNGQFDFVLFHATASRVWADDLDGMIHLDYWTEQSLLHYPASAIMTPFVGSHDSTRLLSRADYGSNAAIVHHQWSDQSLPTAPDRDEPYDRTAIALTWTLTVPGAPLLYYGDEYGEHGAEDPDNRHMWTPPSDRSARQRQLYDRIARVGQVRAELAPLRRGDYSSLTVTEDVLSFARTYRGESAVVAINHAATTRTISIDVPATMGSDGALLDRLDPNGRTLSLSGGRVSLTLAGRSAAVLTKQQ